MRGLRHHTGTVTIVLLVAVLSVLTPYRASADVRDTDAIGGVALTAAPDLRSAAPDLAVPAGILVTGGGETLWSRDADAERAMASTTKIMTAVIALERIADLSEPVRVPASAVSVGEADVGLAVGQTLSARQLVDAMLVHSGNDAATALALHVAGSEDAFVALMNEKAAELGLVHTHFANPHGLDEAGHHTSANDLATLARYAMADATFSAAVGMPSVDLPRPGGSKATYESSNRLLTTFDGATGIKTGWTDDAGYCLVASATRADIELVAVVLGAKSERARFDQAEALLTWGFEHYATQQLTSAETTAAQVSVSDYVDMTVPAVVVETTSAPVFDLRGEVGYTLDVAKSVRAPVVAGSRVGTLRVTQGDRLLAQVPVVAAFDVPAPDLWERVTIAATRLWRRLFGGQLVAEPATVL